MLRLIARMPRPVLGNTRMCYRLRDCYFNLPWPQMP